MRLLDRIYQLGGALAAFFLVMMAVLTLVQIIGRLVHVLVPDASELAGFSMAASSFLALAYTLRAGGHIRVNLLVSRLHGRWRALAEGWCLLVATVSIGCFAWFTVLMAVQSYEFGDLSTGIVGIPLWIPQLGMVFGVVLLEIAFLEECVRFVKGKPATYHETGTEDHVE